LSETLNGDEPPAIAEGASDEAARRTRRWRDLSPQQKKIAVAAVILNAIIASFTWRDLRRRPDALVRGPKVFWRVWSSLNTTGSVAYWLVGRRRLPASTTIIVS
jgi:hypothetical protein